jgi:hypothetical protein
MEREERDILIEIRNDMRWVKKNIEALDKSRTDMYCEIDDIRTRQDKQTGAAAAISAALALIVSVIVACIAVVFKG